MTETLNSKTTVHQKCFVVFSNLSLSENKHLHFLFTVRGQTAQLNPGTSEATDFTSRGDPSVRCYSNSNAN